MPPLAIDGHVIAAAAGQRVRQRSHRLERRAPLFEARHQNIRSEAHAPSIRLERPGQEVDQRRLAAAVRTDDSDAVATHQAEREILDERPAAKGLAD